MKSRHFILLSLIALPFMMSFGQQQQQPMKFIIEKKEVYSRYLLGAEGHLFVADPITSVSTIEAYPGLSFMGEYALDNVFDRADWFFRSRIGGSHKFVYGEIGTRFGQGLFGSVSATYLHHFEQERVLQRDDTSKVVFYSKKVLHNLYLSLGLGFSLEDISIEATYRAPVENTLEVVKTNVYEGSPRFGVWRHAYVTVTFWLVL